MTGSAEQATRCTIIIIKLLLSESALNFLNENMLNFAYNINFLEWLYNKQPNKLDIENDQSS